MPVEIDSKERLEFIMKLLERYEMKRANLSNRAATILSAHAFLFIVTVFLLDKLLDKPLFPSSLASKGSLLIITCGLLLITVFVQIISICCAISSVGWILDKGEINPQRLLFHGESTRDKLKDISSFSETIKTVNLSDLNRYATAELWYAIEGHINRYKRIRASLFFLVVTPVLLVVSFVAILVLYNS